ncbi:hypothetical protein [Pendulispora albinea]|uniref:Uncharacterized protein n=1 Tax=Pendulispora albinea TaxID=2741071 RepID=A0ABZ2LKQ2_9BACT
MMCQYVHPYWWTGDFDDGPMPSEGGRRKVGDITVHNLHTNSIAVHSAFIDLPLGWSPDKPDSGDWRSIGVRSFIDADKFRIWWPDDSSDVL